MSPNQLRYIAEMFTPWIPNADVTQIDWIVYDIIELQCDLANDIILKMIESSRD